MICYIQRYAFFDGNGIRVDEDEDDEDEEEEDEDEEDEDEEASTAEDVVKSEFVATVSASVDAVTGTGAEDGPSFKKAKTEL